MKIVYRISRLLGCGFVVLFAGCSLLNPTSGVIEGELRAEPKPVETSSTLSAAPTPTPSPSVTPSQDSTPQTATPMPKPVPSPKAQPPTPPAGAFPGASKGRPRDAVAATSLIPVGSGKQIAVLQSPSKNIGCQILPDSCACGVLSRRNSQDPLRAGTSADWFRKLTDTVTNPQVVRSRPFFESANSQIIPYGQSVYYADFVCGSASNGMTCWNVKTGHGFFMSKETIKEF